MNEPADSAHSPVLARNCTVDLVVALTLFIFGAVIGVAAWKLGARWTSDGPGAGYFPFYIALIICIASLGIAYQALSKSRRDTDAFVDREQMGRVLSVFLPAMVFVLAVNFLGLYVASAVYIALFMIVLGNYSVAKSAAIGFAVSAVSFMMFEVWFKVPLYKGTLEPLRFLGY